jgi:hypothetical protein
MSATAISQTLRVLFLAVPLLAQQPQPSDVSAALSKVAKSQGGKLEPPLQAIARAWRLHGIAGAQHEAVTQNVALKQLRFSGIIRLTDETRKPEVERALRRAWGAVTTTEENRLYAMIPIPALERISRMDAVQAIEIDRPMHPDSGGAKEKIP